LTSFVFKRWCTSIAFKVLLFLSFGTSDFFPQKMASDEPRSTRSRSKAKLSLHSPASSKSTAAATRRHSIHHPKKKHRHFSMLRELVLADLLTLGNSSSGVLSILSSVQFAQTGDPQSAYYASGLLFLALVFDVMDGYPFQSIQNRKRFVTDFIMIVD
jgi:hypothetical protein